MADRWNQSQSWQCSECWEWHNRVWTSSTGQVFCTSCWQNWKSTHHDPSSSSSSWPRDEIDSSEKEVSPGSNQRRWGKDDYHHQDGTDVAGCYCDSHCHLDYMLLNEKHGFMQWMRKAKMCSRWEEGWCVYGDSCLFAHGLDDLMARKSLEPKDLEGFALRHRVTGCIPRRRSAQLMHWTHEDVPPPPFPQPNAWRQSRRRALLGCLVTNCCEMVAIKDTVMLVDAGKDLMDGRVYCTFGCHPGNYKEYDDDSEALLIEALEACGNKAVGWGECGLDYAKGLDSDDPWCREQMLRVFARQADIAVSRRLPLVVHSRDADEDTLKVLQEHVPAAHPVHIHAFHGSTWLLNKVLGAWPNSVFGVSGSVLGTVRSHDAAEIAIRCPLSRLVLETDAPFLASEPREIPQIAIRVAELKGVSSEVVLSVTSSNCLRFYRIPDDIRLAAARQDPSTSAGHSQDEQWHAAVDWNREAKIASLKQSRR